MGPLVEARQAVRGAPEPGGFGLPTASEKQEARPSAGLLGPGVRDGSGVSTEARREKPGRVTGLLTCGVPAD